MCLIPPRSRNPSLYLQQGCSKLGWAGLYDEPVDVGLVSGGGGGGDSGASVQLELARASGPGYWLGHASKITTNHSASARISSQTVYICS